MPVILEDRFRAAGAMVRGFASLPTRVPGRRKRRASAQLFASRKSRSRLAWRERAVLQPLLQEAHAHAHLARRRQAHRRHGPDFRRLPICGENTNELARIDAVAHVPDRAQHEPWPSMAHVRTTSPLLLDMGLRTLTVSSPFGPYKRHTPKLWSRS